MKKRNNKSSILLKKLEHTLPGKEIIIREVKEISVDKWQTQILIRYLDWTKADSNYAVIGDSLEEAIVKLK